MVRKSGCRAPQALIRTLKITISSCRRPFEPFWRRAFCPVGRWSKSPRKCVFNDIPVAMWRSKWPTKRLRRRSRLIMAKKPPFGDLEHYNSHLEWCIHQSFFNCYSNVHFRATRNAPATAAHTRGPNKGPKSAQSVPKLSKNSDVDDFRYHTKTAI